MILCWRQASFGITVAIRGVGWKMPIPPFLLLSVRLRQQRAIRTGRAVVGSTDLDFPKRRRRDGGK